MSNLGRFQILAELGRGGMGVVFRAHDPEMARDVAIKVLRRDTTLDSREMEEAVRRFEREAKAAGGLTHSNIVAHYERGDTGEWKYIVMEFVEGKQLGELMSGAARLTREASLSILRQVASALDYAHSRGVIHRDIKPANILVQADGTAKIADFGVAKSSVPGAVTSSSMVIGSPHYMAPEQIEAREVTGRTDQWALAVTAFEMLAGRKPFHSDSVASLFQQILLARPPDPRGADPALPPAVRQVFATALDKTPERRFESCSAFVDALSDALRAPGWRSGKLRRSHVWSWAAAAVAVVVLGGAAAWSFRTHFTTPLMSRPRAGKTVAYRTGEQRKNLRDSLSYVWIAPGRFQMGCSPGDTQCKPNESPQQVTLTSGFWMCRTEVTTGAFKRYALIGGGRLPSAPPFNPGWANDALPVTNVAWDDAAGFCRWAEGRLPTEAEWEYAARAGSSGATHGPIDAVSWYQGNSDMRAHEVAGKEPNGFGLFDTLGNVWEWTADRYAERYSAQSPAESDFRAARGGAWIRDAPEVRVSTRYPIPPGDPDHGVGFRCVADTLP